MEKKRPVEVQNLVRKTGEGFDDVAIVGELAMWHNISGSSGKEYNTFTVTIAAGCFIDEGEKLNSRFKPRKVANNE